METIISIISVILFVGFMINRLNKNTSSEEEHLNHQYDDIVNSITHEQTQQDSMDSMRQDADMPDTIGLMFKTLNNLGCQPTKNEDGTLSVSYQGENFHMEFGGMYARVWDPMWAGIKADDPDLPQVREAVNATNFNFGPTVVMTAPNDDGVIGFHTRRDIMLHPACPDNVSFVKAVLDSFFDAKEQVRSNFQQITTKQVEQQKKHRPIGFTTYNQENDE